jgi:hypothetical protein
MTTPGEMMRRISIAWSQVRDMPRAWYLERHPEATTSKSYATGIGTPGPQKFSPWRVKTRLNGMRTDRFSSR